MKKMMAKFNLMLALVCCLLLLPVLPVDAADGTMQISDSGAAVGETATVTVTVEAGGQALGDCEATLTYDTAMLEFVSGTDATGGDGSVSLAKYGTGTETEFTFELQFKVLEEGSTTLTLGDSVAYLFSDETLSLQATGGTISSDASASSGAADVTGGGTAQMNGVTYEFYEEFTDDVIPAGFTRTVIEIDGNTHNAIVQDISGKTMVFLVSGTDAPVMALYDETAMTYIQAEYVARRWK